MTDLLKTFLSVIQALPERVYGTHIHHLFHYFRPMHLSAHPNAFADLLTDSHAQQIFVNLTRSAKQEVRLLSIKVLSESAVFVAGFFAISRAFSQSPV